MNIAGASDRVYGSYSPHSKNTNQKHLFRCFCFAGSPYRTLLGSLTGEH